MDWDINWADREWVYDVFDHVHLDHWQRVNHYRNGREVCGRPRRLGFRRAFTRDPGRGPSSAARTC